MFCGRSDGWRGPGNGTNLESGTYLIQALPGRYAELATRLSDDEPFPLGKPGDSSSVTGDAGKYDVFVSHDVPSFFRIMKNAEHVVVVVLPDTDTAISRLSLLEKMTTAASYAREAAPEIAGRFVDSALSTEGFEKLTEEVAASLVLGAPGDMKDRLEEVANLAHAINIIKNADSMFELKYAGRMIIGQALNMVVSRAAEGAARGGIALAAACGKGKGSGDLAQAQPSRPPPTGSPRAKDSGSGQSDGPPKITKLPPGGQPPEPQIHIKDPDLPEGTHGIVRGEDLHKPTGTSSRSQDLGRALEVSGDSKPGPGYDAHHIVPWNDPRAGPAQQVLEEAGIPLDSVANGVWLPDVPSNLASPRGSITEAFSDHATLHTSEYYNFVNNTLQDAGPNNAQEALNDIKAKLILGSTQ